MGCISAFLALFAVLAVRLLASCFLLYYIYTILGKPYYLLYIPIIQFDIKLQPFEGLVPPQEPLRLGASSALRRCPQFHCDLAAAAQLISQKSNRVPKRFACRDRSCKGFHAACVGEAKSVAVSGIKCEPSCECL